MPKGLTSNMARYRTTRFEVSPKTYGTEQAHAPTMGSDARRAPCRQITVTNVIVAWRICGAVAGGTLLGRRERWTSSTAALLNGISSHVLDSTTPIRHHDPSGGTVAPAAFLALAEHQR